MRYFGFIIFFLISSLIANAQIYWGAEGGVLGNTLIGFGKPQKIDPKPGPVIGFFTDGYLTEHTSVFIEYRYERRSFAFHDTIPFVSNGRIKVEEYTDYFSVPIHLKFRTGDDVYNSYALVGVEFAIPLIHYQKADVTIENLPVPPEEYASFDHSWYDYGLIAGMGLQARGFMLKGGVFYGLKNFYQGRNILEIRNAYLYGTIGYLINFRMPRSYRRLSPVKALKHKIKKLF